MQARLTELNYNEILMYLGYRGQAMPAAVETQIRRCILEVMEAAEPKLVWRRLPLVGGQIDGFRLQGQDIKKVLSSCQEVVLMAATIGSKVERLLMRREVSDMADAVIMDSCASTAIENVCDNFEFDLRSELKAQDLYLTDRYSPGYGDFPLDTQPELCAILNAQKRIGLTVTTANIMIPRKSVSAIMGISRQRQPLRRRGCEVCSMFLNCPYRGGHDHADDAQICGAGNGCGDV